MSTHIVHFMRGINADTLAALQNVSLSALKQGATDLRIHISSDGGTNDHGFAAYNFLRSLPIPVTTHCISNIESMALILFLAGERRLIVPHGKIKIHPMHWGFPAGPVDHDRLAEFVSSLDFDAKRYADIYIERTESAAKAVNVKSHLAGKAKVLNASGAIQAGIAHDIADVSIETDAVVWWV